MNCSNRVLAVLGLAALLGAFALSPNSAASTERPIAGSVGLTATGEHSLSMFQEPLLVSGVYKVVNGTYQRTARPDLLKSDTAPCSKTHPCPPTCGKTCEEFTCGVTCTGTTCGPGSCGYTCPETCGVTCGPPYNTCGVTIKVKPVEPL